MIGGKKIIHRAIALAATGLALGGCASFADTPPQRITPLSGARVTDGDTARLLLNTKKCGKSKSAKCGISDSSSGDL